jgi:hypothetical protein
MSVIVDELEVVPQQAPPPPGEPTPRAAADLPGPSFEELAELVMQVRESRAARLRAD